MIREYFVQTKAGKSKQEGKDAATDVFYFESTGTRSLWSVSYEYEKIGKDFKPTNEKFQLLEFLVEYSVSELTMMYKKRFVALYIEYAKDFSYQMTLNFAAVAKKKGIYLSALEKQRIDWAA